MHIWRTRSLRLCTHWKNGSFRLCACWYRRIMTSSKFSALELPFRMLFFGSDQFSLEALRMLWCNTFRNGVTGKECVASNLSVVSTSDKSPVAQFAFCHGLELLKWPLNLDDLNMFDLGVLVSFGRLVPRKVIGKFPLGILNVHPSLLPRWRGAAPVVHTVLSDDHETGVSVMIIKPGSFDTGSVIDQRRMSVPPRSTAEDLERILARSGALLLMDTIRMLPQVIDNAQPQGEHGATYAYKVDISMSSINWSRHTCYQIQLQYRALQHLFSLRTVWNNQVVKLMDMVLDIPVSFTPISSHRNDGQGHKGRCFDFTPGDVAFDEHLEALCVMCKDGWVAFMGVSLKKRMSADDFHNGYLSKDKKRVHFVSTENGLFDKVYFRSVQQPSIKVPSKRPVCSEA